MSIVLLPFVAHADFTEVQLIVRFFECNDGTDNDGDGKIDYPDDPGCDSTTDDDETDTVLAACEDSIDNDSDGLIDYPDDPGCDSTSDDSEVNLTSPPSGGGSSGSGGGRRSSERESLTSPNKGTVLLSGQTSPFADVYFLRDGTLFATQEADKEGMFTLTVQNLTEGGYHFALYSIDTQNIKSGFLSFRLELTKGTLTEASNIFIPPTLSVQSSSQSQNIIITEGYTAPNGTVEIVLEDEIVGRITADPTGRYRSNINVLGKLNSENTIRAYTTIDDKISPYSTSVAFVLGALSLGSQTPFKQAIPGDFNEDGFVNLVDFSIAAFWYKKPNVPSKFDLDKSKIFDLRDFSVMLFYWTG